MQWSIARDVSRRFLIPCLLNHCGRNERREILEGLQQGVYPALVANQVLDEGVDVPEVKVAVVIGGTASTRKAKQRLGRLLRKAGNARAILYEVVCAATKEEDRSRRRREETFARRALPLALSVPVRSRYRPPKPLPVVFCGYRRRPAPGCSSDASR
jgi:superfamily II DNA or RNA helicase